ncbi:MAG TPA: FtsX-like permease family protein, partial [Gemmatimonadales bacterium]|nr:FtsX-like permease family protein [Gemmatimonadales bacterium]
AADVRRQSMTEGATEQLYVPFAQTDSTVPGHVTGLLVRTAGPAAGIAATVGRAMQTFRGDLPYASVQPYGTLVDRDLRPWHLGVALFGTFGALALLLAAVGLYGVLAYLVAQRHREMGIRIAVGAHDRDVIRLVVRQGMRWVVGGLVIGIAGALLGGRLLSGLLYGVRPWDPPAVAGGGARARRRGGRRVLSAGPPCDTGRSDGGAAS